MRRLAPSDAGEVQTQTGMDVTRNASITRLGIRLPDSLDRRHKAGVERLIDAMSREYLDERRIADLLAIVAVEA
jgi:hypothetical protein